MSRPPAVPSSPSTTSSPEQYRLRNRGTSRQQLGDMSSPEERRNRGPRSLALPHQPATPPHYNLPQPMFPSSPMHIDDDQPPLPAADFQYQPPTPPSQPVFPSFTQLMQMPNPLLPSSPPPENPPSSPLMHPSNVPHLLPARRIGGARATHTRTRSNPPPQAGPSHQAPLPAASNSETHRCARGHHTKPIAEFTSDDRVYATCNECRRKVRDRRASRRQEQHVQVQEAQIQGSIDANLAQDVPPPAPQAPPAVPSEWSDQENFATRVLSAADQALVDTFRTRVQNIRVEQCSSCHEEWFDLKIDDGRCARCRRGDKFTHANAMDPGMNFAFSNGSVTKRVYRTGLSQLATSNANGGNADQSSSCITPSVASARRSV